MAAHLAVLFAAVVYLLASSLVLALKGEHAFYSHKVSLDNKLQKSGEFHFRVRHTIAGNNLVGLQLHWKGMNKLGHGELANNDVYDCVARVTGPNDYDLDSLQCTSSNNTIWTWARWHLQMSSMDDVRDGGVNRTAATESTDGKSRIANFHAVLPTTRNGAPNTPANVEQVFDRHTGKLKQYHVNFDSTGQTYIEVIDSQTGTKITPSNSLYATSKVAQGIVQQNLDQTVCRNIITATACASNVGKCVWIHESDIGCISTNSTLTIHKDESGSVDFVFDSDGNIEESHYDLFTFQGAMHAEMSFLRSIPVTDLTATTDILSRLMPASFIVDDMANSTYMGEIFGGNTYRRNGFKPSGQPGKSLMMSSGNERDSFLNDSISMSPKDISGTCSINANVDGLQCAAPLVNANIMNSRMLIMLDASSRFSVIANKWHAYVDTDSTFDWMGLHYTFFHFSREFVTNLTLVNTQINFGTLRFPFGPATIEFTFSMPILLLLAADTCTNKIYCFEFGPNLQLGFAASGYVTFGWKRFSASAGIETNAKLVDIYLPIKARIQQTQLCAGLYVKTRSVTLNVAIVGKLCVWYCWRKTFWQHEYELASGMRNLQPLVADRCITHHFQLPPTSTPTVSPTRKPTKFPTQRPTRRPTTRPTKSPTISTKSPTRPTKSPTPPITFSPTKTRAPTSIRSCFDAETSKSTFDTSLYLTIGLLTPSCPSDYALQRVQLKYQGVNYVLYAWYQFRCCPIIQGEISTQLQTPYKSVTQANADLAGYLNVDVTCALNKALMNNMRVEFNSGMVRFNYNCLTPPSPYRLVCSPTQQTPSKSLTASALQMITQHDIACSLSNEFLQEFKFFKPTTGSLAVTYQCCHLTI